MGDSLPSRAREPQQSGADGPAGGSADADYFEFRVDLRVAECFEGTGSKCGLTTSARAGYGNLRPGLHGLLCCGVLITKRVVRWALWSSFRAVSWRGE